METNGIGVKKIHSNNFCPYLANQTSIGSEICKNLLNLNI